MVNYSSSREGADLVVAEITGKGGKAYFHRFLRSEQQAQNVEIELLVEVSVRNICERQKLINSRVVNHDIRVAKRFLGFHKQTFDVFLYFGLAGGNIVNISSVAGITSPANASVYAATKAAADSVTRPLAKELGPRKIRVNSINPGLVETEGVHTVRFNEGDFRKQFEAQSPLGKSGNRTISLEPRFFWPPQILRRSLAKHW